MWLSAIMFDNRSELSTLRLMHEDLSLRCPARRGDALKYLD